MRWTRSARFTTWNEVETARTRSRARAGGRSRPLAASSRRASSSPSRRPIEATRSSSTSLKRESPPCSARISPTRAPRACTSSRNASCLGGKWISLRFTVNQEVYRVGRGMSELFLAGQQHRFGPLELLRLPIDHDDIAVAQNRVDGRLPTENPQSPDSGEHHLHAASAYVTEGTSHSPGAWWNDHRFDLFTVLVGLIEWPCVAPTDDISQDGVPVVADFIHGPDHSRHGHMQQHQHV